MDYLLDTNIISELRKGRRCDSRVAAWYQHVDPVALWLTVLVLAEIRQGIERLHPRDPVASRHIENVAKRPSKISMYMRLELFQWIYRSRSAGEFANGRIPIPYIDGFLAATGS